MSVDTTGADPRAPLTLRRLHELMLAYLEPSVVMSLLPRLRRPALTSLTLDLEDDDYSEVLAYLASTRSLPPPPDAGPLLLRGPGVAGGVQPRSPLSTKTTDPALESLAAPATGIPSRPSPPGQRDKGKGKAKELPAPVDVLVDTGIGFLEKGTAYLRAAANQAFALLSGAVAPSTIDLVLTVSACLLSLRPPARGRFGVVDDGSLSSSANLHSNWSAAIPRS